MTQKMNAFEEVARKPIIDERSGEVNILAMLMKRRKEGRV